MIKHSGNALDYLLIGYIPNIHTIKRIGFVFYS